MERRVLLAVGISIAILILYQELVLKRLYPVPPPGSIDVEDIAAPVPAAPSAEPAEDKPAAAAQAESPAIPERLIAVDTDLYTATISTIGARLTSLRLKHYRTTVDPESPPLELIIPGPAGEVPIGIELRGAQSVPTLNDGNISYVTDTEQLRLASDQEGSIDLVGSLNGATIRKRFTFRGDSYGSKLAVAVSNAPPQYNELGITWTTRLPPVDPNGVHPLFDRTIHLEDYKLKEEFYTGLGDGKPIRDAKVRWAGHAGAYFFVGMAPDEPRNPLLFLKARDHTVDEKLILAMNQGGIEVGLDVFTGPKDIDALAEVGHEYDRAANLGYFGFVAKPLLHVLRMLNSVTGNYGFDIILLTVIIKVLFIPLTHSSMKSMKAMQKLQPEIQRLRERLKDNAEQMNREMMELYKRHKVNPLGGCLPMLLQIPVFIGLYTALSSAVELRHAPFLWWITDLAAPDRLGTLAIPFVHPAGIPVLTLLMGVSMFLQTWMTPSMGDPVQRQMMLIMPVMMTVMFVNFPAGLSLYWLINNVLTIAQQYWMNRTAT